MSSTPLESAADASQAPASAAATAPTSVVGTTRRRRGGDSPLLELPDDDGDEDEEGDFGSESSGGSGSGSDDSDDDDGDAANSDEDAELAAPASGVVTKQEPGTNEDAGARSQLKRSRALADDSDDEDGTSATAPIKREPGTERAGAEKKSKKEKKEKKEKKDKKEKKEKKDKKEKADKKKSLSSSSSSEKEKASSKTSKSRTRDASRFLDTVAADDAGSGADEESEDDDQDFAAHGLSDFITADEDDPFAKVRGSGSILSAAARAADEARRARTHAEIEEEFEERDAAKLRAQVDQRFGEDAEEQYQRELESEEQQEAMRKAGGGADMPLPGVGTNVFIVRCNPGKEALAVWELLAKCQELAEESADGEPPVFIQSAYCVPTAKGYVYVEARKRAHVERAVRDIEWLKGWSIKLVPVSELTETLTIRAGAPTTTGVTNQILREGTFVRVKHGVYRDDLGLVVRAIERGAAAVIKLVPRVDLTAAGIKGRTASRVRPEPALFEPERARMLGGDVTRANGKLAFNFASFDGYKSGLYLDGFLYKQFSQTAVVADLSASPPTQSEVDRFFGGPVSSALAKGLEKVDDDSGYDHEGYTPAAKLNKPYLDKEAALLTQAVAAAQRSASSGAAAVSLTAASAADAGSLAPVFSSDAGVTLAASAGAAGSQSVFAPGDRILAVQGDLVGLEGVVASVSDDGKVVRVKAQNVELEDLLDMPVDQIIKRFEVGDRVLIRTGPLAGFSATVTFVDTEAFQLSVVTDVTKESTDVAFEYAVHTVTIQGGVPAQTSLYRVGDLVQMTGYLGYVVASEPYQCRVMDGDGLIHSVPLTAMGPKRLPRFSTAMDSRHVPIHKGDLVIPTTGPGSGKRCVVQHVVHSRLFVTCKDVLANGGVLAVPASSVTAVKDLGPNALPAALAAGAAASTPWIADDEDPSAVGGIMRPSAAPYDPRNDPMRGRFVKITKGSYKGSKARIVDCLPNAYLVELTSRKNKFQLSRDSVVDLSEAEPVAPTRRADLALGQTPMVGMGVTPFLGGQTPHLGARTPAYDGKTPAYAMTPGYATYDDDGAHDDA